MYIVSYEHKETKEFRVWVNEKLGFRNIIYLTHMYQPSLYSQGLLNIRLMYIICKRKFRQTIQRNREYVTSYGENGYPTYIRYLCLVGRLTNKNIGCPDANRLSIPTMRILFQTRSCSRLKYLTIETMN